MTAKKKSAAGAGGASDFESRVRQSSNRIWLAGLGAFAVAEEEGGKFFRALVKRGEGLEGAGRERFTEVRERVDELADAARERLGSTTEQLRERASEAFETVERQVDDRVASVLAKVGVPTRGEIARLTRRIEELTNLVEKRTKAASKPSGKKRPSKRSAS